MLIPDQVLRVNSQPSKAPRLHKKSLINSSGLFLAANRKPLRVSAVCNTRKGRGAGGGGDWIPQRSPLKRNPRAARSLYPSRSITTTVYEAYMSYDISSGKCHVRITIRRRVTLYHMVKTGFGPHCHELSRNERDSDGELNCGLWSVFGPV